MSEHQFQFVKFTVRRPTRFLVLEGPPGSGKTTVAGYTFRSAGLLQGRKAYIINDDGGGTDNTVDAGILRGIDGLDLDAMTAGCIGCKDMAEFEAAIRKIVTEGVLDWVIIEPVGYAEGSEVPRLLRGLEIEPIVVTLIDVENFADNLVDAFMPSQIAAATVVCLTKYPGDVRRVEDERLAEVMDFIGEHNPHAPVFLLPKGEPLPARALSKNHHLVDRHGHDHHDHTCCGHDHHGHDHASHDHHGHDHHHGDHGVYPIHLKLRSTTRYEDIRGLVAHMPSIYRGKGVVEDIQWHLVRRTWTPDNEMLSDERPPFATFYSREPLRREDFAAIAVPIEDAVGGMTTKQILRSATVSPEETMAAIGKRLKHFPVVALVNRFGQLVTHPEILSITKELGRREGVSPALFATIIVACVRYWLSAVTELRARTWEAPADTVAEWRRALGTSLGYYGYYMEKPLREAGLFDGLVEARPAHLLFSGLRELGSLNSDFDKAKLQAEEARDIAKFGLRYEGMSREEALATMRRCLELAADRTDVREVWANAIAEVEHFEV